MKLAIQDIYKKCLMIAQQKPLLKLLVSQNPQNAYKKSQLIQADFFISIFTLI